VLGCVLAASTAVRAEALDTQFIIDSAAIYNSNISWGPNDEALSDFVQSTGVFVALPLIPIQSWSAALLSSYVRYNQHDRFTGLSQGTAGASIDYHIQPFAGYNAPWLELRSDGSILRYVNSKIRDGETLNLTALLGWRFTDRIRIRAGGEAELRWSDSSSVFDQRNSMLLGMMTYRVSDKMHIDVNAKRTFGAVVITARSPSSEYSDIATASAGDSALSVGGSRMAFRIKAYTDQIGFGITQEFDESQRIEFGVSYERMQTLTGDGYYRAGCQLRYAFQLN